jgi:cytochrome P450
MSTTATDKPTIAGPEYDISARSFWAQDFEARDRVFARFRRECPVSWHRPYESTLLPPDDDTPGFWSVWRHEDIRTVSRDTNLFVSGSGTLMEDFPEVVATMSQSFLTMDDPEHAALRGIVSQAFSPRRMKTIEDWVHSEVVKLVDETIELGKGDFCLLFAKELPGRIFADFFGLPEGETRANVMEAAEKMLAWDDPEAQAGRSALETYGEEAQRLLDIAFELIDERRKQPGEDLLTWVVQAELDGRRLDDWEIGAFFSLLAAAGNDTTRHSSAHAIHLLTKHRDQRTLLLEDLDGRLGGCVEEIIRFATPVQHFRRTATRDTTLRGVPIREGEKVVIWYASGNRDEEAFEHPAVFDITRDTSKHLGFGAGGVHYCLGNALARMMLKHALKEIFTRMPDIEAGEPEYQVNNFIHGVASLPARWTPATTR